MTVNVGDKLPDATLVRVTEGGPDAVSTQDFFKGKRVALFSVPGAFTPTCSAKHLPGFVEKAAELKGKGIDTIACVSVNDAFVMDAWGKAQNAGEKVQMLGDGNGEFTKAMGLELDGTANGMGPRSQRYSMVVDNGVIKQLFVEQPRAYEVSSAEHMLKNL